MLTFAPRGTVSGKDRCPGCSAFPTTWSSVPRSTSAFILLLLSVTLMEATGIHVKVCDDPAYSGVEGFVLGGQDKAIIANWVRSEGIWHVDTARRPSVLSDFHEASGYASGHSVIEAETPAGRLGALARYLDVDWAWIQDRCRSLARVGTTGLLRPAPPYLHDWRRYCMLIPGSVRASPRLTNAERESLMRASGSRSVAVFGLGGTIAMAQTADGGVSPALSASDLLAAVPGLGDMQAELRVQDFRNKPGASLDFYDLYELAAAINEALDDGCMSAVVTRERTRSRKSLTSSTCCCPAMRR